MSRNKVDTVNKKSSGEAREIFDCIHAAMHLFRSEQYRAFRDGPHPMTHMEGRLLGFLARNDGATLTDLVAFMERDKGQLARLVRGLKEQGLIAGEDDKADRRSVKLGLTPAGRAIHETLRRQVARLSEAAVKGFTPAERRQLAAQLQRIRANLDAVAAGPDA